MARAPDPRVDQAKKLFFQGKKLIEISKILDVPEGTIRSWKNRGKWEDNGNATLQSKKCNVAKRTRIKKQAAETVIEKVLDNTELNDRQQLFCILYAMGDSAVSAYQKAYGCGYNTAAVEGCRSLKKPKIREEVNRLKQERFESQIFGEHDIFQWYLDVAMANITDYVSFGREEVPVVGAFGPVVDKESGEQITKEINYVKFKESTEVNGHVIKKVKLGRDGASIELYDSMQAMNWLAENMGMGTGAQQGLANTILQAYKRRQDAIKKAEEDVSEAIEGAGEEHDN